MADNTDTQEEKLSFWEKTEKSLAVFTFAAGVACDVTQAVMENYFVNPDFNTQSAETITVSQEVPRDFASGVPEIHSADSNEMRIEAPAPETPFNELDQFREGLQGIAEGIAEAEKGKDEEREKWEKILENSKPEIEDAPGFGNKRDISEFPPVSDDIEPEEGADAIGVQPELPAFAEYQIKDFSVTFSCQDIPDAPEKEDIR